MDSATQLTPDALPIPRNLKNNFWYVRPSASTSVTIVFLHGIFSDSRSCWLYEGTDPQYPKAVFWPDLVRTDPRLGSPAIYLAGYYTEVDAGDFPIAQCAKQVMDALGLPDDDGIPAVLGSATLVFVCHSMGGIMARYLIERYKDVFRKKGVGLALIASPSLGSDWADIASLAAKYYNQRLAQQLKWRNDALEELHGRFKDLVDRRVTEMPGLFGMEAAETKMIYRSSLPAMIRHFVPNRNTIVDSLSAAQYFSSVTLLPDTDHFSIVKPYGFDHPAHQFLLTFMQHFGKTLAELRRLRIFGEPSSAGSGTDVPEAAFAAPSVQGAGTSAASLAAAAMSSVSQGTQVAIPPQPASRQSISPQLPQGVEATALAEGARTFAREGTPRPRLDELFEIVTNPDDVRGALYPLESATGLSPGAAAYTNARIGEDDIQQTLETALRASRGRLLVTGRHGLGKTREVAELARAASERGWKVLVARDEGNSRLGPAAELPPGWADATVLIVVDNIHSRVRMTNDSVTLPYMDRLDQLLRWFEARLPGSVLTVAAARDEPQFQAPLGIVPDSPTWREFSIVRLPLLTDSALERILGEFAAAATVDLDAAIVPQLVENSDKMPQTMFINVDIARRQRRGLDKAKWNPIEGETWKWRLVRAQADHPGVERVCQALRLLIEGGIPARLKYVTALARNGTDLDAAQAANALVGEGLLGRRQDVLTPWSTDQLNDYLGKSEGLSELLSRADRLEQAIVDPADRPKEWIGDLLAFATSVASGGALERAEQAASRAIDLSPTPRAYAVRSAIRFDRGELAEAESDLTSGIETGGRTEQTLFLRGVLRNLLGRFDGALDDLAAAVKLGRDDSAVHLQTATALYQQKRWPEVEIELSLAIERDGSSGQVYFMRGVTRIQLRDAAGAERDFSEALQRSVDLDVLAGQLRAISSGRLLSSAVLAEQPQANRPASTATYLQRALARLALNKYADAEEDLSIAIAQDSGAELRSLAAALESAHVPLLAIAKDQLAAAQGPFMQAAPWHLRGVARLRQGKLAEAESDFDKAIELAYSLPEVYAARAEARLRRGNIAGADADASVVIDEKGIADPYAYGIRAVARIAQGQLAEGEQDATKSIDSGGGSAPVFSARAAARVNQARLPEADEDLSKALEFGPDAALRFRRGAVRLELGRSKDAEADFTAAQELGLETALLFSFRGLARLSQGQVAEADDDVTRAFELGATDVSAYWLRGLLRFEHSEFADAELDFNVAERLGPQDAQLFFKRARAREELARYEDAEGDYDRVLAMGVVEASVFFGRGRTRLFRNNAAGAIEDLTAAVRSGLDDSSVHLFLAQALSHASRYREAEAEFDVVIGRDDTVVARRLRGFVRLARANFAAAEEDYDKVLEANPDESGSLQYRGMVRFGHGDIKRALEDYDRALSLAPENRSLRGARVIASVWLGDLQGAARDCQALEAADRADVETVGAWGVLALAQGDTATAMARFAAAAAIDPWWESFRGLACLAAAKVDDASRAYDAGIVAGAPGDIAFALNEMDRWLNATGRLASPESQAAAAAIRVRLAEALVRLDTPAPSAMKLDTV